MTTDIALRKLSEARGNIVVELALVLPLLLLLALGVAEYSLSIHANNIIVNISREGANLASRTSSAPKDIMDALAETAGSLNMNDNSIMYITRLRGQADGSPGALEQHRRLMGGFSPLSKIWSCSFGWHAGSCISPDPNDPPKANLDMALNPGELVDVVEVFYNSQPDTHYVIKHDSVLYSRTVF